MTPETQRRSLLVVAALLLAWGALRAVSLAWICDDAFVSLRYADHLVSGHGLVYNPGEYVEGYTNLLWTLLVSLGMALGASAKQAGHVLGVAGGAATLVAATLYARSGSAPAAFRRSRKAIALI